MLDDDILLGIQIEVDQSGVALIGRDGDGHLVRLGGIRLGTGLSQEHRELVPPVADQEV